MSENQELFGLEIICGGLNDKEMRHVFGGRCVCSKDSASTNGGSSGNRCECIGTGPTTGKANLALAHQPIG